MDDDKVLAAIAALSEKLDARFETLEQRLTEQERQSKKAAKASRKAAEVQRQQGADIERLKQIVYPAFTRKTFLSENRKSDFFFHYFSPTVIP